jgi:predicted Zn-dependent protease
MPILSLRDVARHLSRSECEAITKRVLSFSTADECRVTLSSGVRANTRFAVNQISTAGDNYNNSVSIRSVFGKKVATVTVNRLDDATLKAAVENSERIARLAPDDPELMPELGPQSYQDSIVWNDATASLDPESRADAVRAVTEQARRAGLISTGYLEAQAQAVAIANSKGLFAYQRSTGVAFTTTVRTEDGTGSGWAGATSDNDFRRIDPARPRRTRHREGPHLAESGSDRARPLHRGPRAHGGRQPHAVDRRRPQRPQRRRGALLLLQARRRKQDRREGRR